MGLQRVRRNVATEHQQQSTQVMHELLALCEIGASPIIELKPHCNCFLTSCLPEHSWERVSWNFSHLMHLWQASALLSFPHPQPLQPGHAPSYRLSQALSQMLVYICVYEGSLIFTCLPPFSCSRLQDGNLSVSSPSTQSVHLRNSSLSLIVSSLQAFQSFWFSLLLLLFSR